MHIVITDESESFDRTMTGMLGVCTMLAVLAVSEGHVCLKLKLMILSLGAHLEMQWLPAGVGISYAETL
jgi:hypothetical protein